MYKSTITATIFLILLSGCSFQYTPYQYVEVVEKDTTKIKKTNNDLTSENKLQTKIKQKKHNINDIKKNRYIKIDKKLDSNYKKILHEDTLITCTKKENAKTKKSAYKKANVLASSCVKKECRTNKGKYNLNELVTKEGKCVQKNSIDKDKKSNDAELNFICEVTAQLKCNTKK